MSTSFPFQQASQVKLLILDVDGVLTAGDIFLNDQGEQLKAFHVRDGHGIKLLQRCGVDVAILTGRTSEVVMFRAKELGIRWVIQGSLNKSVGLDQLLERTGMNAKQCAYMGDDVIDLPAMRRCGFSTAPKDAHLSVKYQADWVSDYSGGQGAVRELAEGLILALGQWKHVIEEPYGVSPVDCGWQR